MTLLKGISWIAIFFVVMMQWQLLNDEQSFLTYRMNKTSTVADSIIEKAERIMPKSNEGKILICGTMEEGNYPDAYSGLLSSIKWTTASYGTIWPGMVTTGWVRYMRDFKGVTFTPCNDNTKKQIIDSQEYKSMPIYPMEGSYKIINGVLVIKLS